MWGDTFHFLQVKSSFALHGLLYCSARAHVCPLFPNFTGVVLRLLFLTADSFQTVRIMLLDLMLDGQEAYFDNVSPPRGVSATNIRLEPTSFCSQNPSATSIRL